MRTPFAPSLEIAPYTCERSSECSTTEWLSDCVLDSGPASRQCALSLDRGGKPGGVTDKTFSAAISVGWKPDRLGGSRRARRGDLAGSQCDGAPLPPSPIDQLTAAMPPGALVVCFALTPYGVIHQGPHVRSSLMSSPVDNSTHSIFSA